MLKFVRYFNRIFVAIFVVAILYLFLVVEDDIRAVWGAIDLLIIFLPAIIYSQWRWLSKTYTSGISDFFQFFVTIMMLVNALGSFWFYRDGLEFDSFAHLFNNIILGGLLSLALMIYFESRGVEPQSVSSLIITLSISTIVVIFVSWEIFEYFLSSYRPWIVFNPPNEPYDVWYDLIADFLSLPLVAIVTKKYLFSSLKNLRHDFART